MRKIKSLILGWIYRLGVYLPPHLAVYVVNRTLPLGRPVLDYLEFHVADHCNLNCAGCLHYAPFAPKRLASLETVSHDFRRLGTLFSNIRHVRIMGGEPLLHPNLVAFARVVRQTFPRSRIRIVTNGLALPTFTGLPELSALKVGIDWTKYPPTAALEKIIRDFCAAADVNLRITESPSFMARLRPQGFVCARHSFAWCRSRMYCLILDEGRIAVCASARYADSYNRRAGSRIPVDLGIDIHTNDARSILRYLMQPVAACTYCSADARTFPWKRCEGVEDWLR